MENDTIAVLCPMDCECEKLLERLVPEEAAPVCGFRFWEGRLGHSRIVVARCGVGTVNAGVCAALTIERYAPRCLLLFGTSGAHREDLQINDVVVAETIVSLQHALTPRRGAGEGSDCRAWADFGMQTYFAKSGKTESVRSFSCDPELVKTALRVKNPAGRLLAGTVAGADRWDRETDLIRHYRETKATDCEAMEGTAVAQVCAGFGVPMLEVRVISNNELLPDCAFSEEAAYRGQDYLFGVLESLAKT